MSRQYNTVHAIYEYRLEIILRKDTLAVSLALRTMPAENFFKEVKLPQQKINRVVLPIVLSPNTNGIVTESPSVSLLTDAIKEHKPWLESLLHQSGAAFFRGSL